MSGVLLFVTLCFPLLPCVTRCYPLIVTLCFPVFPCVTMGYPFVTLVTLCYLLLP